MNHFQSHYLFVLFILQLIGAPGPTGFIGLPGPVGPATILHGSASGGDDGISNIYYSTSPQILVTANSTRNETLQYTVDLGVVTGFDASENTVAIIEASITSRIELIQDYFDDDDAVAGLGAVYLEFLAYEGCTDAVSCAAVTPTTLLPGRIPIHAVNMATDYGDNDDSTTVKAFLSTDQAMFLLNGGATGDYFLQAVFSLYAAAKIGDEDLVDVIKLPYDDFVGTRNRRLTTSDVEVSVDSWVMVVSDAQDASISSAV